MRIEKNNFVVTFKTEKEISDYFGMHIPEEQRLLWLGFFIANNYISHWLEQEKVDLRPRDVKGAKFKLKQAPASWKTRR